LAQECSRAHVALASEGDARGGARAGVRLLRRRGPAAPPLLSASRAGPPPMMRAPVLPVEHLDARTSTVATAGLQTLMAALRKEDLAFAALADSGGTLLSEEELGKRLPEVYRPYTKAILLAMDRNGDGQVDEAEFDAVVAKYAVEPERESFEDFAALMDRTKIGTLDVPNMGLGTIAWTPKTDEDRARIKEASDAAKAAGLNFFDTAERYGASPASLIPAALAGVGLSVPLVEAALSFFAGERAVTSAETLANSPLLRGDTLGPALLATASAEGLTRGGVSLPILDVGLGGDCETNLAPGEARGWAFGGFVGTKFSPTPWRRSPDDVVEAAADAATRLGVDAIDLYQVHFPDIIQPFRGLGLEDKKDEIYWEGLAKAYHAGLVKNVGVSNYGPTLLARAHKYLADRGVPLASNQIHFNLLYRRQGALATVEKCKELGVACLAYYPLAMGLLSGKLTPENLREKTDVRSRELLRYLEGGEPTVRDLVGGGPPKSTAGEIPAGGISSLVAVLNKVAERVGKTPAQVSLNWIMCKGAIPLAGASSAAQVQENSGALGWRLDPEDVAILDAAADKLPFEFRGCGFQTADSKFVGYKFERWQLD